MKFVQEGLRFGVTGVLGFLVDATVLYLLKGAAGLFAARLCSFLAAVFTTWVCNRRWTFSGRSSGLGLLREFAAYLALMLVGGAANYGVYVVLILSSQLVMEYPVLGVAAGSLAGMLINLATSKLLLFRHAASAGVDRFI